MKPRLPIFSFVLLLLFVQSSPAFCQQIIFNKILPPGGKAFDFVTGITQDTLGYMWFTSGRVLYRYNGYEFTTYKNDPFNPNSLAGEGGLIDVLADKSGFIWVSDLEHGLNKLDPQTGIFTHYRHNEKDASSISSDRVYTITEDHEGYLWIGTNRGLNRLDNKTGKFISYEHDPDDPASLSNDEVRIIYEDRSGSIWVGTGNFYQEENPSKKGGLNRLDRKTGTFVHYLNDPNDPHSLIDNRVTAICEDASGIFWVGTAGDGLHTMDRATGKFERHMYDPAHPEKLSRPPQKKIIAGADDHITFINEDVTGAIWIGTFEGGLNRYDPKIKLLTHYEAKSDPDSLHETGAWEMYSSREGVIWISTREGGLYRIDPLRWNFPHYPSPGSVIQSFYEEPAGILWIGTEEGLFRKDLTTGIVKRYMHDPLNPASLGNNYIQHILKDRQGNIWLGTHGGLDLLNKDNETFSHYRHDPKNSSSLSSDGLGFIYEDPQAKLWIVTTWGLNLMDRKTGTFTSYFFHPKDTFTGKNNITYILKDSREKLWVGSWAGLYVLNPQNGKFKDYLEYKAIYSLCEDAQGDLWVGTRDGLYLYNRMSDGFTRFVDPSSLADITEAISITEDNQRNLWICFTHGLIKLNAQRNETTTYGSYHGVNDLVLTYCHKGPQGKLYFSDLAGYLAFFPDQLNKNAKPPEIVITSFRLADQLVKPGKQAPLTESLLRAKKIQLHYNQNIFSFDFAAFDYSNPQGNRHLYMLENYDNTWRQAGSEQRAYYFNIQPGTYTFRVKAANSNGLWAEKSVTVIITPPWWRTWWAYTFFALLFIVAVWSIIYYRSRKLIKEKQVLEKKVNDRTAEVVKQKEEIAVQRDNLKQTLEELKSTQAQLVQREKMASLGELTAGIAHEIQNPLNFVNNFSELNIELTDELKDELNKINITANDKTNLEKIVEDIGQNEQKINHHGKRADTIVKGMLQHSRSSSGIKEPTDINSLVDEYLRLSYHGLRAKDKTFNATIQTDFDQHLEKINIVPQDVGRVILNLFTNAFYSVTEKKKQHPEGYEPTVLVRTKKMANNVVIRVRDNGLGIPQKVLDKIFQPFFTTKPTGQGTGLGLSMSYDIIVAHGGELKVETKEGEFAEFIIQLITGQEK